MTVQPRQRHVLVTFVLCCMVGTILSTPVTTTSTTIPTSTSIATTPDSLTSSTAISPPHSSSSSSSSSSVATSSQTSTSISSSSSSSSEKDTLSHNDSLTADSASPSNTKGTEVHGLILLQSDTETEDVALSDPSSKSTGSSQAVKPPVSSDLESSSPVEASPSNQVPPSLHSDPDSASVTSTSHSPRHPENNIQTSSQESSTDSISVSSTSSPSSEAPLPTSPSPSPSLSDADTSKASEAPASPTESRTSFSEIQEEPESLSAATHPSSQDNNVKETVLILADTSHSTSETPTEEFHTLTKEFYEWRLQDSPQLATEIGINEDNTARLDDYSFEHYLQKKLKTEEFLERAQRINTSELSEVDQVHHKIFVEYLSTFIRNFRYIKYFYPVSFMGGPHTFLQYTVKKSTILKSYNDYTKLILKYKDFPRQADQLLEIMKGHLENGLMPSNWSLRGVVQQFDDLLVPFNESVFFEPFKNISIDITEEQKEALKQEAEPAVDAVLSALKKMRDYIQDVYYPAARPEVGVSSLPEGLEYYKACLEFHTSTKMSPQQVHDLGLSEVARIQREVKQTARTLGMSNNTLVEISATVKSDPKMKFASKEDLLDTYKSAVYNDIYPLMHQIYDNIPDINITVEDNIAGEGYASYSAPAKDGSRQGTFFINAKIYEHHRRYEVNALSLHEAVPGHHMQTIVLQNIEGLPEYVTRLEYYPYSESPAKYPLHTAYVEGWGLYSEYLGNELGLYKDPYQKIGSYSFEILRASRMVVDTGIHALGWSRQKAIDYLLQNTFMSRKAIENQIDRYITLPAQATSYKVGELKILELRQKAEKLLGEQFRLQDFHKAVLRCPGPLNILEECIDTYITKNIAGN